MSSETRARLGYFLLGLWVVGVIAATTTPLNRAYLQSNLDGSGKSITNVHNLNVTNNAAIGGDLTVTEDTLINGTLSVPGLISAGKLTVLGSNTVQGISYLNNVVLVTGNQTNTGNLRIVGILSTTGNGGIGGDLIVTGDELVNGTLSVPGLISAGTIHTSSSNTVEGMSWLNGGATIAFVNLGQLSDDPGTPADGCLWYNTTTDKLKARINGATVELGASLAISDITSLTNLLLVTPKDTAFTNLTADLIAATTGRFNTLRQTNGAALNAYAIGDASGNLEWKTAPPDLTLTNLTAQIVNSPAGRFNNLRMTNGASAGAIPVSDANGNFAWSQDYNVGGSLIVGSSSQKGALLVANNSAGTAVFTRTNGADPFPWFLRNHMWKEFGWTAGASGGAGFGCQSFTQVGQTIRQPSFSTFGFAVGEMTTSTSSNNAVGFYSSSELAADSQINFGCIVNVTSLANIRFFAGITTAGNEQAMVQSDDPSSAGHYSGVSFISNGTRTDTNWQLLSRDGSTASRTDGGTAATTGVHEFWMIGNAGGTSWEFYLDGALLGTKTTNPPGANQNYQAQVVLSTQTSGAKTMRLYMVRGRARPVF